MGVSSIEKTELAAYQLKDVAKILKNTLQYFRSTPTLNLDSAKKVLPIILLRTLLKCSQRFLTFCYSNISNTSKLYSLLG